MVDIPEANLTQHELLTKKGLSNATHLSEFWRTRLWDGLSVEQLLPKVWLCGIDSLKEIPPLCSDVSKISDLNTFAGLGSPVQLGSHIKIDMNPIAFSVLIGIEIEELQGHVNFEIPLSSIA